jgi:hypothetical protein
LAVLQQNERERVLASLVSRATWLAVFGRVPSRVASGRIRKELIFYDPELDVVHASASYKALLLSKGVTPRFWIWIL